MRLQIFDFISKSSSVCELTPDTSDLMALQVRVLPRNVDYN